MKPNNLTLSLFILFISFLSCNRSVSQTQESQYKLSDFEEVDIQTLLQDDLRQLNYSSGFRVELDDQHMLIIKDELRKDSSLLVIDGGKLIGKNRGEWGGSLIFRADSDTIKPRKICNGNIVDILKLGDQVYVVEGLAHLSFNDGSLYKLEIMPDTIIYEEVLKFNNAPEAISVCDNRFLIAAHNSFYIVENNQNELIFEDTFWNNLYPNSIACIDNQNVYVGIRGGIVKLDIDNRKMTFYKFTKI